MHRANEATLESLQWVLLCCTVLARNASACRYEHLAARAVGDADIWDEITTSARVAAVIVAPQGARISVHHDTQHEIVVSLAFDMRTLFVSSVWLWLVAVKHWPQLVDEKVTLTSRTCHLNYLLMSAYRRPPPSPDCSSPPGCI